MLVLSLELKDIAVKEIPKIFAAVLLTLYWQETGNNNKISRLQCILEDNNCYGEKAKKGGLESWGIPVKAKYNFK